MIDTPVRPVPFQSLHVLLDITTLFPSLSLQGVRFHEEGTRGESKTPHVCNAVSDSIIHSHWLHFRFIFCFKYPPKTWLTFWILKLKLSMKLLLLNNSPESQNLLSCWKMQMDKRNLWTKGKGTRKGIWKRSMNKDFETKMEIIRQ